MTLDVSIVVPARNEADRLPRTYGRLIEFLEGSRSTELIVSVDPESIDQTSAVVRRLTEGDDRAAWLVADRSGKGAVLKAGITAARGSVVLLADADLSVDPKDFRELIDVACEGKIAIASRSAPGAERVGEPWSRFVMGRVFNGAVRALILPGVRDSQCGFKAFSRDIGLRLIRDVEVTGWAFDVEFLACARREGLEIRECPVRWTFEHGGTVRMFADAPSVGRDLLKLWRRLGRVSARSSSAFPSPPPKSPPLT